MEEVSLLAVGIVRLDPPPEVMVLISVRVWKDYVNVQVQ